LTVKLAKKNRVDFLGAWDGEDKKFLEEFLKWCSRWVKARKKKLQKETVFRQCPPHCIQPRKPRSIILVVDPIPVADLYLLLVLGFYCCASARPALFKEIP